MTNRIIYNLIPILLFVSINIFPQERNYNPSPMLLNVGHINLSMNKMMGDGGLQSQFSWDLTGGDRQNTEIFYWPEDWYQSNMLYQIFNPISIDDSIGITDQYGKKQFFFIPGFGAETETNFGLTDWAYEVRRYRPPHIIVDGLRLDPPYQWYVNKNIPADEIISFEDVQPQYGIRSHVDVYAFSNPNHANYFIWKATHKFTGELQLPRTATSKDTIPDQTIKFWWPISFSFGPSKAGEKAVTNAFMYEGQDDLDSWFKRKSDLTPSSLRDSLYVAYYWDTAFPGASAYSNGSTDDAGDPDRTTGFIHSPQVCGFSLLHADKSYSDRSDDISQPYAMPHADIEADLWGKHRIDVKYMYRGDYADYGGRFPLDPITAGFQTQPLKGPMRFITVGPYTLTKDTKANRIDSLTFVYAVGVGGLGWNACDSLGRLWLNKKITDGEKDSAILNAGKDSLWNTIDRANWAWNRISQGLSVPTPPPVPDIEITSGPDQITVQWSYPDPSYFKNTITSADDWYAWRVYRKQGASLVNDPLDQNSGARWQVVYQTTDRNQTTYVDKNVTRGVDYYYAVSAVNNGSQNDGIYPGEQLESNWLENRTGYPAVPYKAGLSTSKEVRVVPNPATVAAGSGLTSGTPDKISFFNLPYKCVLRIFTETGDLVKTIVHLGTADEEWNQRTDENQYVSSGIYILAVTDCEDVSGKSLQNDFVKFILVR